MVNLVRIASIKTSGLRWRVLKSKQLFIPSFPAVLRAAPFLVLLLCLPGNATGGYSKGGAFNLLGYGARAWGMGGAAVASGGDEGAVYWNPAFLSCLASNCAGLSYVNLLPGTKARQSLLAYARIIREAPKGDVEQPAARHAAGFMYANLSLGLAGDMDYSENVFRFAYAYTPEYFLSFGVAASLLISRSDVPEFNAEGSSIDAGLRLQILRNVALGFVVRNAASQVMYSDGQDETLGRRYTLALSLKTLDKLLLESASTFAHGGIARTTLGGEYALYHDTLFLRSAASLLTAGESRLIPYFGLGFKLKQVTLHYNANLDTEKAFEDTHRFSLSVGL